MPEVKGYTEISNYKWIQKYKRTYLYSKPQRTQHQRTKARYLLGIRHQSDNLGWYHQRKTWTPLPILEETIDIVSSIYYLFMQSRFIINNIVIRYVQIMDLSIHIHSNTTPLLFVKWSYFLKFCFQASLKTTWSYWIGTTSIPSMNDGPLNGLVLWYPR